MPSSLRGSSKATAAFVLTIVTVFFFRVQILLEQQITAAVKGNNQIVADIVPSSTVTKVANNTKYSIPSSYDPGFIHPRWTCSSPPSLASASTKVIFVHVFKTAGSTFRTFFHSYGEKCGRGVSTIVRCSHLSSSSLESPNPNDHWEPGCDIKKALSRENKTISMGEKLSRGHLQKHADIVIGHLPLGIHEKWVDDKSGEQITPQYISFFREPLVKFVSGRLFVEDKRRRYMKESQLTFDEALRVVKAHIRSRYRKEKYYIGYKEYLATPQQKDDAEKYNFSEEQWVQTIMRNIIEMHVIVGLVENMGESVGLIQSIIDTEKELTDDFRSLVDPSDSSSLVANKSKLSSSKIVATLRDDEKIWKMLNEVLKYEFELYNFAVEVHNLQVKEMKKRHGDLYSFADRH